MQSLYLNHIGFKGFCKPRSGGAIQKFPSPLSALRRGVWGEPHKKMKGKILGLPRERSERPEARQVFRSKKVRAKANISPPNVTSRFESVEVARAEGVGEGRKARRFATNSLGTGAPKRADLSLFRI